MQLARRLLVCVALLVATSWATAAASASTLAPSLARRALWTSSLAMPHVRSSSGDRPDRSHPRPDPSRYHLVALKSRRQAAEVRRRFGRKALWAWDGARGRFRSTVNYPPARGATLYTPAARYAEAVSHAGSATARVAHRAKPARRRAGAPATTTTTTTDGAPRSIGTSPPGAGPWNLVFDDEFNGSSLDTAAWAPLWFSNGSNQNGTTMESSNVSVSGGNLNLELASNGTGALVSTNPSDGVAGHRGFQFSYGYVEARIYLPASGSTVANWPAFWTDGQSWPADGELDVVEGLSGQACFHFHSSSGGPGGCATGGFAGWHTFGADWEPGKVTYYYDGQAVGTITTGITSQPMYLILENSDGSSGGTVVAPSDMLVDWVRVWQH